LWIEDCAWPLWWFRRDGRRVVLIGGGGQSTKLLLDIIFFCRIITMKGVWLHMDKDKKEQGKKCFIITPIGNENSDTFRKAKGVIDSVIKPVLAECGFDDIKPAYEINVSGMINTQIINRIIEDDLVIANLTDNNPNVMYELCLRHVAAGPIIHICEEGTELPFDIKDSRTIFYKNDMLGVEELKDKVNSFLQEIVYEKEYIDNPIYVAYGKGKLLKETQGTDENAIVKLLVEISEKVSEMKIDPNRVDRQGNHVKSDRVAYTMEQFARDIRFMDRKNVEDAKKIEHGLAVYELAKHLNTSSKAILDIANFIGVDVRAMASMLSWGEKNKILECILDELSAMADK